MDILMLSLKAVTHLSVPLLHQGSRAPGKMLVFLLPNAVTILLFLGLFPKLGPILAELMCMCVCLCICIYVGDVDRRCIYYLYYFSSFIEI